MDFTFAKQLHYLVHQVDNQYVAHCLDLDLVGTGDEVEQAVAELNSVVRTLVYVGLAKNSIDIMSFGQPAPARYWSMFEEAQQYGEVRQGTLVVSQHLAPVSVTECHLTYCLAMAA